MGTQSEIETDNGFIEGWGGLTYIHPEEWIGGTNQGICRKAWAGIGGGWDGW